MRKQDLTPKQKDALAYATDRVPLDFESGYRAPLEAVWDNCARYYEGVSAVSQSVFETWDEDRARIFASGEQETENHILPIVQRGVSLVLSGSPEVVVVPASPDRNDQQAAILAQAVWQEFAERTRQAEKDRRATLLSAVTGCSIWKTTWNPKGGRKFTGTKPVSFQGEVEVEVASSWEFDLDPYAMTIEDAQWARTTKLVSLERIAALYPELESLLKARSFALGETISRRSRMFSGSNAWLGSSLGMGLTRDEMRGVLVTDFWARPSKKFPKGLRVLYAGNAQDGILLHQEIKNPHVGLSDDGWMELPFDQQAWSPPISSFWPIGLVFPMVPIQRQLAMSSDDINTNRRLYGHPRMLLHAKSKYASQGVPADMDEPLVVNDDELPPAYLSPPPMPEYVLVNHERMLQALGTVAAQSDASQAKAPGEVRTGVAIELLQERDESVYGPIRQRFLAAKSSVARRFLMLAQSFYDTQRTIQRVGVNKAINSYSFQGADLAGAQDIRLVVDTGQGMSKVGVRARIQEDLQNGTLNPADPIHIEMIGKALGTSFYEPLYADANVDRQNAEDQITVMSDTSHPVVPIMVDPLADHAIHFAKKRAFTQRPEFRELPEDYQANLRENLMQHALMLAQQAEQEQAAMDPGEAGGGSPPKEPGQGSAPKPKKSEGEITDAKQRGGMK